MSAFEVFASSKDSKDFLENLRMIKNQAAPLTNNESVMCEKYCKKPHV